MQVEIKKSLRVNNKLGLHAREAARTVELVKQYESKLVLRKDDREADGSNILSILTLDCPQGTEIEARVTGNDAEELMDKLSELFEKKSIENI